MKILARTGQWYLNNETGQHFEIVAIDEHSGSIGIQYVDGDLDELDAEIWSGLALNYAAEPEDPAAAFADPAAAANLTEPDTIPLINPASLIDQLEGDTFDGFDET